MNNNHRKKQKIAVIGKDNTARDRQAIQIVRDNGAEVMRLLDEGQKLIDDLRARARELGIAEIATEKS